MLRDQNLIPLSHQHQHALALCVRIERALPIPQRDLSAWQAEIIQIVQAEIGSHFAAEEQAVFPAAQRFEELIALVDELVADHAALRADFARAGAGSMSAADLAEFARHLSAHIRKEERLLFERLQELMSPDDLALLGRQLEALLKQAMPTCLLPTETTRLRPAE